MFAWVGRSFLLLAVHDRKFQHHLMKKLFGMEKEEREKEKKVKGKQRRGGCCAVVKGNFLCENSSRVINSAVVHG